MTALKPWAMMMAGRFSPSSRLPGKYIPDSENPRTLGERPLVLPTPAIGFAREHELSSEPAPGAQGGYRSLFTLDLRPSRPKTDFDMLLCLGIITLVAGQSKLWGVRK